MGSSAIPLWLDCDPGHDDAFAILLSLFTTQLHLLGLSTVHGNASLSHTTENALRILTALGRERDVAVRPGCAGPLDARRGVEHASDIHGVSGLDGTGLLPELPQGLRGKEGKRDGREAIVAMRTAIMAQEVGTAWIVATGALTNVALAFREFPELVRHIRGLSIMGGAMDVERRLLWKGDAEFNIYCDPEAAQSIFANAELAAKTTLIPLDLTHQVIATADVQKQVLQGDEPGSGGSLRHEAAIIRPLFHDLLTFFAGTYRDVFGMPDGPPLHDPVAVAVLLDHDKTLFEDDGEKWNVDVVTDDRCGDGSELGRTVATKANDSTGVRIPRAIDVRRFWTLIYSALSRAEESRAVVE